MTKFRSGKCTGCCRTLLMTIWSCFLVSLVSCSSDECCEGTNGINWVSNDCGNNVRALNTGKRIHEFMYHPTQPQWALAASWTSCAEFIDEPCKIYKELYYTKTMGEEWTYITNYVYDFEWGQSRYALERGIKIPDERIFVTRDADGQGHQTKAKDGRTWSTKVDLFVSDNFF